MGDKMTHTCKNRFFHKMRHAKGIWFHIAGLIALIWFCFRVLPAPHRSQYPCQQLGIPIAFGYIAFWSALLIGLIAWIKKIQTKTIAYTPVLLITFILLFSISGLSFANTYNNNPLSYEPWDPTPNQPIGTPQGLNPGRVTWVWNANATEKNLDGYWWESQNNDQNVIDTMFSQGLKSLANTTCEKAAWDALIRHFNINRGKGEVGYTPGEKIAIKVNLNNCWNPYGFVDNYEAVDNERDAHPNVIKSLLYQLTFNVGVDQTDIYIYDSSRPIPNWFYDPIAADYPDVHYIDLLGEAPGRTKARESDTIFYFSDGITRTLPVCVTEAEYLINIPLLKQHPINHGVTLSGKNLFGTFIEPVIDLHPYHESGQINGNPAPQVDLLGSDYLGGKTLLYIGDGLYATLNDHRTIYHFQMYPFNDDWTNSLFFSQDPVAIDSVMYDFLHTEGPNPIEGSQNYLHESAEPKSNTYDPENDGTYFTESLGVHEHWDTTVSIFSNERYTGPNGNGIDFIPIATSDESPSIILLKPEYQKLYVFNNEQILTILYKQYKTFQTTIIIGSISVQTEVRNTHDQIDEVQFYVDGVLQATDNEAPYEWIWNKPSFGKHILEVSASYNDAVICSTEREVLKLF